MLAFTIAVIVISQLNQIIVVVGDVFRTLDDVLVFNDVVKHHCRIIHDITNDVSVRA
ncbi:Uncharacterised protein [Vibrio cholerae]|uniref:Uncharacterized protein n=1 Tax=Vibrio cholerae TaxID=666 RepID=A0A656AL27_VIBCL|nr:Uncharacterised protein [Vibrio cholerae]CSB62903.1 Uncharacterised protein [Vibrio cholerae]CSC67998.1 Uncharacterised protein [Vibrio cholerae]CSC90015.1 Uncharacterised protein [Vibrio cholerae]CSD13102.1 Uncharacterised protein [Vibrio cholerae]